MLHLKNKQKFQITSLFSKPMVFSPIAAENDELVQAIENDSDTRDDNWTLEATPDTRQLNQFWSHVVDDIEHDPTWHRFDDE